MNLASAEKAHAPDDEAPSGLEMVRNGEPAEDRRCLLCQRVGRPFERAVAYGGYDRELRDLVHLLKFQQVRPAAAVLGGLLSKTIAALDPALPPGEIIVVPVPLHQSKRRQRGFNQAEMIACAALADLSRPERWRLCPRVLARRRQTGSQIGLNRHQRRVNMRGAFSVEDARRILNRDVLLIDDVMTTGATVSECAKVLRRAGAARVWVATVGRASNDGSVPVTSAELLGRSLDRVRVAAHG